VAWSKYSLPYPALLRYIACVVVPFLPHFVSHSIWMKWQHPAVALTLLHCGLPSRLAWLAREPLDDVMIVHWAQPFSIAVVDHIANQRCVPFAIIGQCNSRSHVVWKLSQCRPSVIGIRSAQGMAVELGEAWNGLDITTDRGCNCSRSGALALRIVSFDNLATGLDHKDVVG